MNDDTLSETPNVVVCSGVKSFLDVDKTAEVLETFGLPDSVWLDDKESTKFLYYFVLEIQDYKTIEISSKTDSVSGFEWD